ncbi:MAG: LPS assembly protein LptD [Alphaproteobacteria bacterium]
MVVCLAALPARAQDAETDQPVVFSADEVVVDEALNMVIATGNVEISQAGRLLNADTVTYNRRTDVVTASGNVVIIEPSGEVIFADYAELDRQLADGFIANIGVLFEDESRLVARRAVRRGQVTDADRAVYSPCALCPDHPDRPPVWQLRAARVTHDMESSDIIYRDAFLDFFGIPVLYTPYFSHPDPTVDRRTGLLAPRFGSTADLGPFLDLFYYWDIAPHQDATFRLGGTGEAGLIGGLQYRRRFESGEIFLDGTINQSDRIDSKSGVETTVDDAVRGHVFAGARFDIDEHWRVGADVRRSSDDTYLSTFEIASNDILQSRAYAEGFYGLSFASVEALDFQDLRRDSIDQPLVVPSIGYNHVSEPGSLFGGQWFANASALHLLRDSDVAVRQTETDGVDTRRLSLETGWRRDLQSDFGLLTSLSAAVRGDLYWSDNLPDSADPTIDRDDVTATRAFPRATITARYPLARQDGTVQQLIEPIVAFTAAPNLGQDDDIPNNDSVDLEFDEINLFSDSRFPGIDRVEGGLKFTYGLHLGVFGFGGGSSSLFVGQSYRFSDDATFPDGSGLEDNFSDIVGRITITPSRFFNLDYRYRFDHKSFDARRQELTAIAGPDQFRLRGTYTFVDEIAGTGTTDDVEEITTKVSSRLSEYWSASASYRRDLVDDESRDITLGLAYADECLTFGIDLRRDFTQDRDSGSGDSIFLVLNLRHLGGFPFAVEGTNLFN